MDGFPRLYAAASLKRNGGLRHERVSGVLSAALCRGLIEASKRTATRMKRSWLSAALCRGLIEAFALSHRCGEGEGRFPRLYAAASLKPPGHSHRWKSAVTGFPRLYAAASLKLPRAAHPGRSNSGFPRLYAAASLKRSTRRTRYAEAPQLSAALCRGLIEAPRLRS